MKVASLKSWLKSSGVKWRKWREEVACFPKKWRQVASLILKWRRQNGVLHMFNMGGVKWRVLPLKGVKWRWVASFTMKWRQVASSGVRHLWGRLLHRPYFSREINSERGSCSDSSWEAREFNYFLSNFIIFHHGSEKSKFNYIHYNLI